MLTLAVTTALLAFGARDALLLLGSTRPVVQARLIAWTAAVPLMAIACGWRLDEIRQSPLLWATVCSGHLLRWAAANWFDLRPRRNGLVWTTAMVPAPGLALGLLYLGPSVTVTLSWCTLVIVAVLGLGCLGVEPILDDVGRYSQCLDLLASSLAGVSCAAALARHAETAVPCYLVLCTSTVLLFCAARKACWS